MALDTQEKRMAAVGVGRPWARTKFPIATPDIEWRASSANSYGPYISAAAYLGPPFENIVDVRHRQDIVSVVGRQTIVDVTPQTWAADVSRNNR